MEKYKFTVGDPEKDFFEQNPELRYLDSSVKLLRKTKPETASKVRWAVFMLLDPDSKFYVHPLIKRVELVNNNYLKGDITFNYDPETMQIFSEDFQFVIDTYASETMSKAKRDYYEREQSYQLLVQQERDSNDLKLKADVQLKLARIYETLEKTKEKFEEEKEQEKTKARGSQQPGIFFGKK